MVYYTQPCEVPHVKKKGKGRLQKKPAVLLGVPTVYSLQKFEFRRNLRSIYLHRWLMFSFRFGLFFFCQIIFRLLLSFTYTRVLNAYFCARENCRKGWHRVVQGVDIGWECSKLATISSDLVRDLLHLVVCAYTTAVQQPHYMSSSRRFQTIIYPVCMYIICAGLWLHSSYGLFFGGSYNIAH